MQLTIDNTHCDQCGTCISVCPHDALTLTESLCVNDQLCSRCARCVKVCPFGALKITKDDNDSGICPNSSGSRGYS